MDIRISVLMGIYNCAETLPDALNSLYAQTYQGFKIILCDDGSTDNTYAVAKAYQETHENIILLKNKQNLKLAATLNHCLEYADTEFVARMDGDDISLPTRFEKQIFFLDNHPEFSVVSTPMIYFDENGDWGKGKLVEKPKIADFKYGAPHTHAPSMMRTHVLKKVNGYTANSRTIRIEDYYLWYKIYKAGFKCYNIQEPLYKMRDDKNAMARRTFSTRYNNFIVKREVLRGLGFSNAFIHALPSFLKAFIPKSLMRFLRKQKHQ